MSIGARVRSSAADTPGAGDAGISPAQAKAQVRADGGRGTGDLHIINGFAARVSARTQARLAKLAGVHAVSRDAAVKPQGINLSNLATAYPASVDAPQLWNYNYSVTGKGVGVAVIDTGIAGGMPDFRSPGSSSSRVIATAVTNPDARTAPDSAFSRMCPSCVVDGQMIRAGGTSMAAPMISGVVALMLQYYPNLKPDQVKGVLKSTARTVNGKYPAVEAYEALKSVYYNRLPSANQGLTPNAIVDPATGEIDYTRSSWSRSSWSTANDGLTADFARSSWSRSSWSSTSSDGVDVARSSWSRSSWSTSWDK